MSEAELWREIRDLQRQLEELKTREKSVGSVTSVGLTMPTAVFDVANSPVTGSGTLAVTFDNQSANTVFSGPSSGAAAAPTFRALVDADIPITSTRIPYGDGSNKLTTEAALAYIAADDELRAGLLRLPEGATPTTPASGFGTIFVGNSGVNNGVPSGVDDAGTVYQMVRYATGTFTPALAGSGTAGTFTYDTGNTEAQYTRIGDRVLFNGRIIITATAVAPTGNLSITGLPIAAGANGFNGNILGGVQVGYSGLNLQAGYTQVEGWIVGGATSALLYEMGDNVGRVIVQGGELGATSDFFFTGWYKVD